MGYSAHTILGKGLRYICTRHGYGLKPKYSSITKLSIEKRIRPLE